MRIAALQMQAVAGDVAANLSRIEDAARAAASGGASLLIAPELAVTGYGAGNAITLLAEPAGGAIVARLTEMSRASGVAIVAGFAERDERGVWNSAVHVDARAGADRVQIYRKSHLYAEYERNLFRPAPPAAVAFDHDHVKVGMLICYDVEFPENVRRLARSGCALVAVPTALPAGTYAGFIARQMIPVRAFENQVFVAYINHCGADALFSYAGLSTVAAPDGSLLAAAPAEGETLVFADIDPAAFAASAKQNSYLADLRTV